MERVSVLKSMDTAAINNMSEKGDKLMSQARPSDFIVVRNARRAVKAELEKKKILGQPIAKLDPKTGAVFLEHADGSRTDIGFISKKGNKFGKVK